MRTESETQIENDEEQTEWEEWKQDDDARRYREWESDK